MNESMTPFLLTLAAMLLLAGGLVAWQIRRRYLYRWLPTYLREVRKRRPPTRADEVHVLLCFADHFEPKAHGADRAHGLRRVETWVREFPQQFGRFRDSDGRPPRYTFFFPVEVFRLVFL